MCSVQNLSLSIAISLLLLVPQAAADQQTKRSPAIERAAERVFFTFRFENDYFVGSDRHYTSGLRFGYVTPEGHALWGSDRLLRELPFVENTATFRTQFALTQHIYTPDDIEIADPPRTDRPYAGLLTFDVAILARSDDHLDMFGVSLGVTGRPSLAQDLQIAIHSILPSSPRPEGWQTQVPFEAVFQAKYDRIQYFGAYENDGFDWDFQPRAGFDIGTAFVNGYLGGQLRLGNRLYKEPGVGLHRPGAPGVDWFAIPDRGDIDIYAFVGLDARVIGRNFSLDGGVRSFDRSVDTDSFVLDVSAGLAISHRIGRVSFTGVRRQREFATQEAADWYGSLAISIPF